MKIYFGSSISSGRAYLFQAQGIVDELKKMKHKVLSKHVVDPQFKPITFKNRKKSQPANQAKDKELFKEQCRLIDQADLMVAEVSQASWGTAFLMEYALSCDLPVIAMFYNQTENNLSPMVTGHPNLFVCHYNQDNLKTVLKKNLAYFQSLKAQKGKLVVIDGTNGSGKATQTAKLINYFKQSKVKSKHISFPRYYSSFHGRLVGRFLKGEFGGLNEVNPYLSSLTYALDRLTAKDEIIDWLKEGNIVIADRYTTSSMAHQAVKVPVKKRQQFLNWLYQMEYKEHKMPKEDIVIYLYVSPEISDKLILQKAKKYRGSKKRDIEEGLEYQRKVSRQYLKLCKKFKHWIKLDCVDKQGKLLSIETIHSLILKTLRKRKII